MAEAQIAMARFHLVTDNVKVASRKSESEAATQTSQELQE
jgi:hypothetical protein